MDTQRTIYDLVTTEEEAFKLPIHVNGAWEWNMHDHIQDTVTYKYGQVKSGKDDNKPIKNIILPTLRLRYRTEGFDLKDVELFVDDKDEYWKSFIVKKYHQKWALDNKIDTFIDRGSENDIDFGGVLVKDVNGKCPEIVPWESIAFCDQTDILSGPIGIKHNYSPEELLDMASFGWGKFGTTLEDVIQMAENQKSSNQTNGTKVATPGKYIEVYEVHGYFPVAWLTDDYVPADDEKIKYCRQVHIVTFYDTQESGKKGICLYRGKLKDYPFKFRADKIHGRALGYGGVEELTEAQVWTNYDQIRIKGLLDAASKVIYNTDDPTFETKNQTEDMDNGEIVVHAPGTTFSQVNTTVPNMNVFENNLQRWTDHANRTSGATDSLMGVQPTSGTPFKSQELITNESMGLHEYRMGKYATFIEEVYRDIIIPNIAKDLTKGETFLTELDLDELQYVVDAITTNKVNEMIVNQVLAGNNPTPDMVTLFEQMVRDEFKKKGNKHFIEIVKDEFSKTKLNVRVNIKGKQKDAVRMVDKLTNIFRFAFSNPDGFIKTLQVPGMAKSFNELLEYSGLSPVDFAGIDKIQTQPTTPVAQEVPQGAPIAA